jgi:Protein of unknown function (DUF2505)
VHFEAEHEFPGSCAAVAAVLCDPDFHTGLDLPDLSRPTVVEHGDDGGRRTLTLRYEYVGRLDPIARKVIAGRELTWIQALRLDTTTFAGTLTFSAEAAPDRLNGQADVALVPGGDSRCSRRIGGDLHVKFPLVGGTAERRIVPGLLIRLDVEAAALGARLT